MFSSLRNYNFRLFWTGQLISLPGNWLQTTALAWLVLVKTNSPVALGTVTMLQFLPIILFTLIGGVVADRVDKRRFLLITQSLFLLQALALGILDYGGWIQIWEIYLLSFIGGVATAFDNPTRQSFVMDMVGREDIANAIALNSGLFNSARIIGPALAGIIIDSPLGTTGAFLLNSASFLGAIIALSMMKPNLLRPRPQASVDRVGAQILEGWRYCFSRSDTLMVVALMAVVGTFGYNFQVILPLLAKFTLNKGAAGLGALTASMGVGSLVSALFLAHRARISRMLLIGGAAFFCIFWLLVSYTSSYGLTCALLIAVGFSSVLMNASCSTLLQTVAPDRLRGRVMSIFFLLMAGSTPIGGYLTGWLAARYHIQPTIRLEALISAASVVWAIFFYFKKRMILDDLASRTKALNDHIKALARSASKDEGSCYIHHKSDRESDN